MDERQMAGKFPSAKSEDDRHAVQIPALVLRPAVEKVRCVRRLSGVLVYEFWTDGKQAVRINADVYDAALRHARENPQQEDLGV